MLERHGLSLALGCAILAILFGIVSARWILRQPTGNERMIAIATAIQEGARAYLNRQYLTIGVAGVVRDYSLTDREQAPPDLPPL